MGELVLIQPIEVSGRRFSTKHIQQIKDTVTMFKSLSRRELAQTICEHLNWESPNGRPKVEACLSALKRFEYLGLLALPATQTYRVTPQRSYVSCTQNLTHAPLLGNLTDVSPLELRLVTSKDQRHLWNGYIEQYHYLGYKTPFGPHLRYFITSHKLQDQYLGCLLFAPSAWALKARDEWIGWSEKNRKKRLSLVINNSRFLIFPWVKIECLASRVLSMAATQVATDWNNSYGYRPVLLETFVDEARYKGTCYQAANWQYIGDTTGRGRTGHSHDINTTIKKIFVYPLTSTFRATLRNEELSSSVVQKSHHSSPFVDFWQHVVEIIDRVTREHDEVWQKRDRIINSMMLTLLIFRVLLSKNSQGYHTTILEFWDVCHRSKLSLPQKKPIAPSSFSEARSKLDENIFKTINTAVIRANENQPNQNQSHWKGHRLFAVDGSKINLPRSLIKQGFDKPQSANYPQGLLSTLYQLKSKMPYDFDLVKHGDERVCALSHLPVLKAEDVVVYDRGYFSYKMLYEHFESQIHAVFRLPRNSYSIIDGFIAQPELTDVVVTIEPLDDTRRDIARKYPELIIRPLQLRLIKYTHDGTEFYLGTTLFSESYSVTDFSDVYHSRWGIEELYKVSKKHIEVEDFHGRSERGIRQELYAHFVLITLSRLFSNHGDFEKNDGPRNQKQKTNRTKFEKSLRPLGSLIQVNFKNCIAAVEFEIESLILYRNESLSTQIEQTMNRTMSVSQKVRPNRSYPRKSMKPDTRWQQKNKSKNQPEPKDPQNMTVATA